MSVKESGQRHIWYTTPLFNRYRFSLPGIKGSVRWTPAPNYCLG